MRRDHFSFFEEDAKDSKDYIPFSLKPLEKMHFLRMNIVSSWVEFYVKNVLKKTKEDVYLLDLGCGAGLTTISFARMGWNVYYWDTSPTLLQKTQDRINSLALKAHMCSSHQKIPQGLFDVVISLEVIEHVDNPVQFIQDCQSYCSSKGLIILSTINRNIIAYIYAIVCAEFIFRMLPHGTHDTKSFISPQEMEYIFVGLNYALWKKSGMAYRPLTKRWIRSQSCICNYIASFIPNEIYHSIREFL